MRYQGFFTYAMLGVILSPWYAECQTITTTTLLAHHSPTTPYPLYETTTIEVTADASLPALLNNTAIQPSFDTKRDKIIFTSSSNAHLRVQAGALWNITAHYRFTGTTVLLLESGATCFFERGSLTFTDQTCIIHHVSP